MREPGTLGRLWEGMYGSASRARVGRCVMGHRDVEVGRSQIPQCHESWAKQLRLHPVGDMEALIRFYPWKKCGQIYVCFKEITQAMVGRMDQSWKD